MKRLSCKTFQFLVISLTVTVLYCLLGTLFLIIMNRQLTGKWYLKRKLFGFTVMVQTIQTTTCEFDFSTNPDFIRWEKAKDSDFIELGIICT